MGSDPRIEKIQKKRRKFMFFMGIFILTLIAFPLCIFIYGYTIEIIISLAVLSIISYLLARLYHTDEVVLYTEIEKHQIKQKNKTYDNSNRHSDFVRAEKNVSNEQSERIVQNRAVELFHKYADHKCSIILSNMSDTERVQLVDEYRNYIKYEIQDMSPNKIAKVMSALVSFKRDKQKMIYSYFNDELKEGSGLEYLRSFMLEKFCEGPEMDKKFGLLKDYVKDRLGNDKNISLTDFLKHLQ